ncbi:hypothetical protein GW17_00062265, partial [Ensete ventricosum]
RDQKRSTRKGEIEMTVTREQDATSAGGEEGNNNDDGDCCMGYRGRWGIAALKEEEKENYGCGPFLLE